MNNTKSLFSRFNSPKEMETKILAGNDLYNPILKE